jgi:drug/metabolite transporter (DMT)-like permease
LIVTSEPEVPRDGTALNTSIDPASLAAHASVAAANRRQSLALATLIVGALIVSSSGVFVRLSETGPTATAFWRGILAVPGFAIWIFVDTRRRGERASLASLQRPTWGLFWAGACFAADLGLWHWSLMLTSVAASTLEANLSPLVVTLIAWIAWKQRPAPAFLIALLLALSGLFLIVSPKLAAAQGGSLFGDVLGVGTAVAYGGYLAIVSRLRGSANTGVVMFWTSLFYSLLLLPIALTQTFLPHDLHGWTLLIGLALIVHCLGQGLIAYAFAHLPAAYGAVGLFVQPVASGFYAWLILGEQFTPVQILGAMVILSAIVLARIGRSSSRSAASIEPVERRLPE